MIGESLDHAINPLGLQSVRVSRAAGVATIRVLPEDGLGEPEVPGRPVKLFAAHKDIGEAVHWLGLDDQTRVVVITGTDRIFVAPHSKSATLKDLSPAEDWALMDGLRRTLEAILTIDKPVIASVNGDAVGYGSSLMFACDFIIACDDALIADHHLGMGELPYGKPDFGFVPGDGGSVFVPLYMPPPMAKEYLMLARTWSPRELAAAGVINYAVARTELEAAVAAMCEKLIRRPRYALAWSKRVLNQTFRERFNNGYDAGIAYEFINIYQRRRSTQSEPAK
jgi:enoyl-CoA hydratase